MLSVLRDSVLFLSTPYMKFELTAVCAVRLAISRGLRNRNQSLTYGEERKGTAIMNA